MIEIDGSYLEGGGQILRTAISLSSITQKECYIFNIRKKREKSGLMPQHLLGLEALALLCDGKVQGGFLGSKSIKFYPGKNYKEKIFINIPTAGSIPLILQTLITPSLFSPNPIEINFSGGATDTFFSPTIDYFRYCFLKILEKMEAKIEVEILKRGYYPEGGARVRVKILPTKLKNLNLIEKGEFRKILIISGASEILKDKKVSERQISGAKEILKKLNLKIEEKIEYYKTDCPGSQICIIAEFGNTLIGTDNLGKLKKKAQDVGKEAALELLKQGGSNSCLDKHLADQILPYLALAEGKSKISVFQVTNHLKTNIWIIEKFIQGKFEIKDNLISWIPK